MRLLLVLVLPIVLAARTPQPTPTVPVQSDSVAVEPDLPGGGVPTSGEADPEGEARLVEARQRWGAQRPEAYRFTYTRVCFCPPQYRGPFVVTVRGDGVVEAVYQGEGEPVEDALEGAKLTVDALFDVLGDAYERRAESVQVAYDEETGQPTSIQIDYNEQIADEEVGFTIEPVEPLAD